MKTLVTPGRSLIRRVMSSSSTIPSSLPPSCSAALRNRDPIRDVLAKYVNVSGGLDVLEVSSGDGTHVAFFADAFPEVRWQPTEVDAGLLDIVRRRAEPFRNVRPPSVLDVTDESAYPPSRSFDLVFNSNLVHISEFACAEGLFRVAGRVLKEAGGRMLQYGPFAVDGVLSPESNVAFDKRLKGMNPGFGIRDVVRDLKPLAAGNGLELEATHEMPANNKILVWRKL